MYLKEQVELYKKNNNRGKLVQLNKIKYFPKWTEVEISGNTAPFIGSHTQFTTVPFHAFIKETMNKMVPFFHQEKHLFLTILFFVTGAYIRK